LDLDQCGIVYIAVRVFAIAADQQRVERGAAVGGRYSDLQSTHALDDRLERISRPFPSIFELEFQYALIVGAALDAATLP